MFKGSLIAAAIAALALMVTGAQAAPGNLDTQFGSGGIVTTNFGGEDTAYGVAAQNDGNIVAAGTSENLATDTGNIAVARYKKGKVTTDVANGSDDSGR